MTPEELKFARVRSFLLLSREEFEAAKALQSKHRRQSVYLLQQAVEKALRGILEIEGKVAGPMHSIRGLAELLAKDHPLREAFLELDPLSAAATRYRYPTASGTVVDIGDTRLAELADVAETLLSRVHATIENFLGHSAQRGA